MVVVEPVVPRVVGREGRVLRRDLVVGERHARARVLRRRARPDLAAEGDDVVRDVLLPRRPPVHDRVVELDDVVLVIVAVEVKG